MKTQKRKLSFTKATVVDLGNVRGGKADVIAIPETWYKTQCDKYTDCFHISRCWTVCGGHACY